MRKSIISCRGFKQAIFPLIPESLRWGQLLLRRRALWHRAGIIFIHIPKNGGYGICKMLYGGFMGHYPVSEVQKWTPRSYRELSSFAITRNPWSRTLSIYRFARSGGVTDANAAPMMLYPERYRTPFFSSFERFIMEWLPDRSLGWEESPFQPQTHFVIGRDGGVAVSHLGRLENLSVTKTYLEDVLSKKIDFIHVNRTGDDRGYQEFYTPAMRDMVATVYRDDVERFAYDF